MGPEKVKLWTSSHNIGYHYRLSVLWAKDRHTVTVPSSPEDCKEEEEVAATLMDKSPEPAALKVPAIDVDSSPEELEKEAELRADASGSVASCSKRKSEGTNDAEAAAKSKRPKTWNHMLLHNRIQATRA